MNDINTYILMLELKNRINDFLNDPEPKHDTVMTELVAGSDIMITSLEALESSLNNLMNRYTRICQRSEP
jgi:hypothetical protein